MHHQLAGGITLDVGPLARGRGGQDCVVGTYGDDRVGVEGMLGNGDAAKGDEAEKAIPGPLFAPKSAPLGRSEP